MCKAHRERAKGNTIKVRARLISPDTRWFPDQEEEMVWHGYLPERGYFGFRRKEETRVPREDMDVWDRRREFLDELLTSCVREENTVYVSTDAARPTNQKYQATCVALVYRQGSRVHTA